MATLIRAQAYLHVGAGVLPGLGVQEGGGEAGGRLHLGLGHHACQGPHPAHPHIVGGAQVGHPGNAALPPCDSWLQLCGIARLAWGAGAGIWLLMGKAQTIQSMWPWSTRLREDCGSGAAIHAMLPLCCGWWLGAHKAQHGSTAQA